MEENQNKIKPGWAIPVNIKEDFRDFCISKGSVAQEDCAGALFLWTHLPAQFREWARVDAKGENDAPDQFWAELHNRLIRVFDKLLPSESTDKKLTDEKALIASMIRDNEKEMINSIRTIKRSIRDKQLSKNGKKELETLLQVFADDAAAQAVADKQKHTKAPHKPSKSG